MRGASRVLDDRSHHLFVALQGLAAEWKPATRFRLSKIAGEGVHRLYRVISASERAFNKTTAGCCPGRSLVEAATSASVAKLYSTVPRARPPETLQEQPFPTHDDWMSMQVFTEVAQ